MMPHVHLLVGLIGANLLVFGGETHSNSMWFILGSTLPDIDYIFNIIIKKNSHRQLPTHFPLIYMSGALLLGIFGLLPQFWLFLGAFCHTFLDIIDWEIYLLAPFSFNTFSIFGLDFKEMAKKGNITNFLKNYYQERKIIVIEIIFLALWIFTLFL